VDANRPVRLRAERRPPAGLRAHRLAGAARRQGLLEHPQLEHPQLTRAPVLSLWRAPIGNDGDHAAGWAALPGL